MDTWTTATWTNYSIADLDAQSQDIDQDGAYNWEEAVYGSDPFDYDTDDDGLNDGDEIHLAIQSSGFSFYLTLWDSDGDGVSDFDEFNGYSGISYAAGLPAFTGATYSDYDGDGIKNPFDPYPEDPLNNDGDSDGINDDQDPVLNDQSNPSPYNGASWYGNALVDDDYDSILNFWDAWPNDPANGSSDPDMDGIDNNSDPFPDDHYNFSYVNQIQWNGDVLGDADGDSMLNYQDQWPYDSNNGNPPPGGGSNDNDGDGIENGIDPASDDATNTSPINGFSWYSAALEDADEDGATNFDDPYPYDTFNNLPDFDGDTWNNGEDPFPKDQTNYSAINGTTWYGALFEDPDDDGTPNWQDPYPFDTYDNLQDYDGDYVPNENDPYPKSSSNVSSVNGIAWGYDVIGDADSDGIPNWSDETPFPPDDDDDDDDGFPDSVDPFPGDSTNYSSINGITWAGSVLGDSDGDGIQNWQDSMPNDPYNGIGDADYDGILNESDPAPLDPTNLSSYNSIAWYSIPLADEDNDGTVNFYDSNPYQNPNVDSDGDGFLNSVDPYPNDYSNYSEVNFNYWGSSVLNDDDGDGTPNYADSTPYFVCPPPDEDQDGLNLDQEIYWGTYDNDNDSDDDGLSDGDEVNSFGTNPTNKFSLSEANGWGDLYTDWQLVDLIDTDGDDIPDRIEQHYNLDPSWGGDALLDLDNNGINNATQYAMRIALDADLIHYDSDGDGMSDIFEDYYALQKGTPADAVADADGDGVTNHEESLLVISPQDPDTTSIGGLGDLQVLMLSVRFPDGTNPPVDDVDPANGTPDWADVSKVTPRGPDYYHFTRANTSDLDGDGMPDSWEHEYGRWKFHTNPQGLELRVADADHDNDRDGLTNYEEYLIGTSPIAGDSNANNVKDGSEDADSDGISNALEFAMGWNAVVADTDGNGISDLQEDYDGDGLTNAQEKALGTSMLVADTDGDGVTDSDELTDGTNPLDPNSSRFTTTGLRIHTPLYR